MKLNIFYSIPTLESSIPILKIKGINTRLKDKLHTQKFIFEEEM